MDFLDHHYETKQKLHEINLQINEMHDQLRQLLHISYFDEKIYRQYKKKYDTLLRYEDETTMNNLLVESVSRNEEISKIEKTLQELYSTSVKLLNELLE